MGDPEAENLNPPGAEPAAPGPEASAAELREPPVPSGGPFYGTGRRKTSVARVYLRPGSGQIRLNGRPWEEVFRRPHWRKQAREPLEFLGQADLYDAEIRVHGGGSSGQAGAVRLGLARALAQAHPGLRSRLRQGGFLTRDARAKERKKYGQKGARKRFQWTKR